VGGSGTGSSSPASPAASAASVAAAAELPAPEASEPAPSPGGGGTSMAQRGPLYPNLPARAGAVYRCILYHPLYIKTGHLVYSVYCIIRIDNTN